MLQPRSAERMQPTAQAVGKVADHNEAPKGRKKHSDTVTRPNFGYPAPQIILGPKCLMKYPENNGGTSKIDARTKTLCTHLRMRMPRLRYWDSLRKNQLRTPRAPTYAESKVDESDPFRLNSFSIHSTKNARNSSWVYTPF